MNRYALLTLFVLLSLVAVRYAVAISSPFGGGPFDANGTALTSIEFKAVTIAAGDATPDVSGGNVFVTSSNSAPTAITDLDNPTVNQVITICGGSNNNSTTIADSGNFNINGAVTLSLDMCIELLVQADNDYVERGRSGVVTAESDPQVDTLTANLWCAADATGAHIDCATTAPVLTEVDPQVGTLTDTKWCIAHGTSGHIDCEQNAPALTPWISNIDADNYALTDLGDFTMRAPGDIWSDNGTGITWHQNLYVTGQIRDTAMTTVTPTGTTTTIDWDNGNVQTLTLAGTSGNVTGVTFANLGVTGIYTLKVIQHATVPRTVAGWPTVLWPNGVAPVVTATNSAVDVFSFVYDGAALYGFISGQDLK